MPGGEVAGRAAENSAWTLDEGRRMGIAVKMGV